jgi:hypothetical protein
MGTGVSGVLGGCPLVLLINRSFHAPRYKKTLPGLGRVFGDLVNALCVVSFFSNHYWLLVYYYDQKLGKKNKANVSCD